MNRCKHCKKELFFNPYGLRDFCSDECKKAYRRAYLALKKRQKRVVNKKDSYIDINSSNVNKSNPYTEHFYEEQKGGSETFESYGGKEYYELIKKHCCNFEVREREGYCITLFAPIVSFREKCKNCSLGKALASRYKKVKERR